MQCTKSANRRDKKKNITWHRHNLLPCPIFVVDWNRSFFAVEQQDINGQSKNAERKNSPLKVRNHVMSLTVVS